MVEENSFLIPLSRAGFRVSWVSKIPGVDVKVERSEAVSRLWSFHLQAALELCDHEEKLWMCEQVHGNLTVPVSGEYDASLTRGADGLTTADSDVALGVYVADCGALYLGDPVKKAVAVVHSGKAGTEKNILGKSIEVMVDSYGTNPADLIVSLAPCIRPPAYDVDFAAVIREQAIMAGVKAENYHDCGICTTSNPALYYSYRAENGKTGRMLAMIAL